MIHKRKIRDVSDAIFAIKLIIKIYKKTIPNNSDVKILTKYYGDALKRIQTKFRGVDLSLFKLSDEWNSPKFQNTNQYEKFNAELIGKCDALSDFVESKTGMNSSEDKTIEQRIDNLEKSFKKFDERLNYAISELGTFNDWKKGLDENAILRNKTKKSSK